MPALPAVPRFHGHGVLLAFPLAVCWCLRDVMWPLGVVLAGIAAANLLPPRWFFDWEA